MPTQPLKFTRTADAGPNRIAAQHRQVANLIAAGRTYADIAKIIGKSISRVGVIADELRGKSRRRESKAAPRTINRGASQTTIKAADGYGTSRFLARCPECGGKVYLPCRGCAMQKAAAEAYKREHRKSVPNNRTNPVAPAQAGSSPGGLASGL